MLLLSFIFTLFLLAPQVRSHCLHLSEGPSDISTVYILHRSRHLRPTLMAPCCSPRRSTHVIIIPRNIRRVEKDCHHRKYTGFAFGAAEGGASVNSSFWLRARSVKPNKEDRRARADKDLLMVHFSGTGGKERSSGFGMRCRNGVQEKLPLDKQHLQIKHVPP